MPLPPSKPRQNGQGLIEYIALTALVAIVSLGTVKILGNKVRVHLNRVSNSFDRTVRSGLQASRAPTASEEESETRRSTPPWSL